MNPHSILRRAAGLAAATAVAALLAACSDGANPLVQQHPRVPAQLRGRSITLQLVRCTVDTGAETVSCAPEAPRGGGPLGDIIIGNPYVALASSNVHYDSVTQHFTFDVTVKNQIQQPIGTTDGSSLEDGGVRPFVDSLWITSGSGSISVVPDGYATFRKANQPYYEYDQVLALNAVSSAHTWTFLASPHIGFSFTTYVSVPVQYPNGYVEMDGNLPGAQFTIDPAATHTISGVVKTAVGAVVSGATITWSTSDPSCATVNSSGTVTGVGAGTLCIITGTSGTRSGRMIFHVNP
jgi:hypothetical protein